VQFVARQELAGFNVLESLRAARAPVALPTPYPALKMAIPEWLEGQVRAGELRQSTARMYGSRCRTWVYPHRLLDGRVLGDLPVNEVAREQIGSVIRKVKETGRSMAIVEGIRNPLRGFYTSLIEMKLLPGPNPAADLRYFIGKAKAPAKRDGATAFFSLEEGPTLIAACKAVYPRWTTFIMAGLLAGLRWGETAALMRSDIDWTRGRIHVRRTVSGKRRRLEPPKNGRARWVKASPALLEALRQQIESVDLEAGVKGWSGEQKQLVFPNTRGRVTGHAHFLENVWQPLLAAAKLPYRKPHALRHTYATWLLEAGADIRWVQQQMGHASIRQTADTYGHVQPSRHEAPVEGLDRYVG
jgi:integrase